MRRKTTLPDPAPRPSKVTVFGEAMKRWFSGPVRDALIGQRAIIPVQGPDPWDEAIRWIERKHEAEQEWPWPRWRDYAARVH